MQMTEVTSTTPRQHADPQLAQGQQFASADHADDEKTIREDPTDQGFSDNLKKDVESAKAASTEGTESVRVQPLEVNADQDDDDFPDGGLKAWLVVAGVGVLHLPAYMLFIDLP